MIVLTTALCALFAATAATAQQAPTTTTLVASPAQVNAGVTVTLTATVSGANAPAGTVIFSEGVQSLATVPLTNGSASFSTTFSPGPHSIGAYYAGNATNASSSASNVAAFVNYPQPQITSITPGHLPAGTLDAIVWIRGDQFYASGTKVKVNGILVQSQVDRTTLLRAVIPSAALATQGTATIEVVSAGGGLTTSASSAFDIDAPGPAPLSLELSGSIGTATHLTPGGTPGWLAFLIKEMTGYTQAATFVGDFSGVSADGTAVFRLPPAGAFPSFPPRSVVAVIDRATAAERVAVPSGTTRTETFFPLDGIRGMRDGNATAIGFPGVFAGTAIVVRAGVGAWKTFNIGVSVASSDFQPLGAGDPPAPATFLPGDLVVAVAADTFLRGRVGDFLPVGDPANPGFLLDDASVGEGTGGTVLAAFPLHLTAVRSSPVSVHYATGDGTARAGVDYTATSGDVTFAPGETLKTISIPVTGDAIGEPNETFALTLSAAAGAPIVFGNARGTIVDDDVRASISIGSFSTTEATGSDRIVQVPVTLSAPNETDVTASVVLNLGGTATADDVRLQGPPAILIPAGSLSTTIGVRVTGDDIDEDDETFGLQLAGISSNVLQGTLQATGTIVDDDDVPALSIDDVAVLERTGADLDVPVPFTLSRRSERPLSFAYQLVGGSAAAGTDYVAASGTLQVNGAGGALHLAWALPVTIKSDAVLERNESFSIVISDPLNATIGRATSSVTIVDDDGLTDAYATAVLSDTPAMYYRLDDSNTYAAHDSSPAGTDGWYPLPLFWNVAGAVGTGNPAVASGTGSSTIVFAPWNGPVLQEATAEGWVRGGGSATVFDSPFLSLSTTNATLILPGYFQVAIPVPPLSSGWHHLAVVAKSGASSVYVDGHLAASNGTTFTSLLPSSGPTQAALANTAIDEVAFYTHALTPADVARHYRMRIGIRAAADFDGNGSPDVVLRNSVSGANALWLMRDTIHSSTVDLPWLPSSFRIEGSADFDADGQNDLLLRNYGNGNNALWLMNGTSIKSIVNLPWLPTAPDFRFEGTGDMNGDGSPDILIRNYTNGNNAVWLMNGTSFAGVANLPALPDTNYRMAGGGDFNGDGHPDVVWRNQVTGSNAVWLMNGTSFVTIANLPALPNTAYRFNAIADYDGDGKPDIVLRNYTTGANAIWLLDGVGLKSIANLPQLSNTAYEIMGPR
jgi:hypothetical protein